MNICILDSLTRYCVNKVIVDTPTDFVPYETGIEVAPRHDGEIGWKLNGSNEWEQPSRTLWTAEQKVRNMRNFRLKQSDKYAYPDYPLTPEKRIEWTEYRQQLRDIPTQAGFPDTVVWPIKPT